MSRSGQALTHSTQEKRKIKEVQITVLAPDELRALSVVEVNTSSSKNVETGEAIAGSLADPKLGPRSLDHLCATCLCDTKNCPGHFGHIELARPIYHFGFVEVVKKILSCVCFSCYKLKLPKAKGSSKSNEEKKEDEKLKKLKEIQKMKLTPEARLNQIYKLLKDIKECYSNKATDDEDGLEANPKSSGCGSLQPKYTVDKTEYAIIQTFERHDDGIAENTDPKSRLTAEKALTILKSISEGDLKILGFDPIKNKPSNLILEVIPVSPPQTRPSVDTGTGITSEDDLTYQYTSILKANEALKKCIENTEPESRKEEWVRTLQFFVTTLARNDLAKKSTHKNGRPIKSIRDRISSKEGRIRGNLMGKRVDFSARTVISPDPNLALDELGVPRTVAQNLTFPETVTDRNIDYLTKLVKQTTPWKHPGAKFVKKKTGHVFDLRDAKEINLEIGDIVERHINNGDYVLFNRQPSLHKMSMMAHRIRVLPYSSFRLNLSVTKPYNADFDGDEMNMHVPQSYETRAELKEIMHVPRQIVAPKANQPVMAIEQDALTGIRLYTKRNVFLNAEETMNLMMHMPHDVWDGTIPEPTILKPRRLWTGKQLYSKILPKINVEQTASGLIKEKSYNHYPNKPKDEVEKDEKSWQDVEVIIYKGELLKGIIDSKTVGTNKKGLVHTIWLEYGPEKARNFLTDTQKMVNNWFSGHGYTIGIMDAICSQKTFDNIAEGLSELTGKVANIIAQCERGDLEFQPGKGLLDSLEAQVNKILNTAREEASNKLTNDLDQRNNILHMVNAGSKGKTDNLSQIIACVGQQNIEGKRIPFGFVQRSLPHFTKFDYGARSKGFVNRCYLKGLTPDEFFFHTMGGREGLIDTAVKTAETGYIQRKLVKALEDVMVKYDGTVRDSKGNIIEFLYGEDGNAAEYIEEVKMDLIEYDNKKMEREFDIKGTELNTMDEDDEIALNAEFEELQRDRDTLRALFPDFKKKDFHLSVDIQRLITNAITELKIKKNDVSDLSVKEVVRMVKDLTDELVMVIGKDKISQEMQEASTLLLKINVRFNLASKKVILRHRLSSQALRMVIGYVHNYFQRCKSHPGEMVGAIAAQSISEPTTQMTLNTFHNAGISSKNVTLGVPRVKEIINKANTKTPSLTIYLNDPQRYDEKVFFNVSHDLGFTNLRNLAYKSEIYYDPNPMDSIITDSYQIDIRSTIHLFYAQYVNEIEDNKDKLSPWVLRILLKNDIPDNNIDEIKKIIHEKVVEVVGPGTSNIKFIVVINEFRLALSNEKHPEIRVLMYRLNILNEGDSNEAKLIRYVENKLFKLIQISGIESIKKVYKRDKVGERYAVINNDGAIQQDKKTHYYFETDGSDLMRCFGFDYIDHRLTNSNDVNEIYRVLGIEAARRSILDEIRKVLSSYGIYINFRHLAILCDTMCHRGYIMAINRNGINRIDCGPLRKCSFEETLEMLLVSAAFSKTDPLAGVSENIMLGQLCRIGTGYFDLMVDYKKLKEPRYIPNQYNDVEGEEINMDDGEYNNRDMMGGMMTPNVPQTPNVYVNTPSNYGGATDSYSGFGGFTPNIYNTFASPAYTPNRGQASPGTSSMMSPFYPIDNKSPGYLGLASPQSSHSPQYSPIGSAIYNPISPNYSPSASPSLSSSDRARGGLPYSPSSPHYSSSPKYSPSGSASPKSAYSSSPSGTPGSQPMGSNPYTPNTPGYTREGHYKPTSPSYNPEAKIIPEEKEGEDEDGEQ